MKKATTCSVVFLIVLGLSCLGLGSLLTTGADGWESSLKDLEEMEPIGKLIRNSDGIVVHANKISKGDKGTYLKYELSELGMTRFFGKAAIWIGAASLICCIGLVIYAMSLNAVPKPTLSLNPDCVPMGQSTTLRWSFAEKWGKLKRLEVSLHGEEKTEDTSGSSTTQHKKAFVEIPLLDLNEPQDTLTVGQIEVNIPPMTLPTFKSAHSQVVWSLRSTTTMPMHPKSHQIYENIIVLPPTKDPNLSPDTLTQTCDQAADPNVKIDNQRTHFLPGEEIKGTVSWQLSSPDETVNARLCWRTSGKGDEEVGIVESITYTNPQMQETRAFSFKLPEDAIPNFSGALITLTWAVELVITPPMPQGGPKPFSVKPKDRIARATLVVSPIGRELTHS